MNFARLLTGASMALSLAACDNQPNPDFEKSVQERQAAKSGDAYGGLEATPLRFASYANWEASQKAANARTLAATFDSTYARLVAQLKSDSMVDRSISSYEPCLAAFAAARSYAADGKDAGTDLRKKTVAALKDCRTRSIAIGKTGNGKAADTAALLRRFASAGLILVGGKTAGQGKEVDGSAIWQEGAAFAAEDGPKFKITAKSFRGY